MPANIADWDGKNAYSAGANVRYWGGYYRANRDIAAPWFFNNDAPDSSAAWTALTAAQVTALIGIQHGENSMSKIPGPALCGFADYFEGDSLVGAGKASKPPARPSARPQGPPAKKPYPKATQNKTVATHAVVLKQARQVLAKAHGQVKTAAQKTLAKPAPPVSRGRRSAVMGVAQTPKAKAAQAKAKAAQVKAAQAKAKAQGLAATATKTILAAHKSVTTLATHVKNQENVARKLSGKGGAHGVHGYLDGAGVHGYIGVDANGLAPGQPGYDSSTDPTATPTTSRAAPDPSNPGFLTDGSIDPNYAGTSDGTGTAASPALDVDTLVSALPAGQTPIDQHIADMNTVPSIKYDGSKGTPDGYVGSVYLFTRQTDVGAEPDTAQIEGNAHFGYVWGRYDKSDPANGGVGWGSHLAPNTWNHVHGRFWLGDDSWHNPVDPTEAFQSAQKQVNLGAPGAHLGGYQTGGAYGGSYGNAAKFMPTYGPLVGNPVLPDFKNMRVDDAGNMFWIASEAPDYITWPLKAAAALTKAATDKAAKDAAAAAAAAQAKAAADAAAALAAQQAQNALDEANAASAATQTASAAQGQSAQAQADADTADAQSAAADAAAAQQQAQADAAAARQAMMERQQALQEQQFQFQQYQQAGGGGGQDYQQYQPPAVPQYADDGSADDGSGGTPDDGSGDPDPEAAADTEAANIEADADVLGRVLGQPRIAGDDDAIGGDGELIGLDQYGNLTDD